MMGASLRRIGLCEFGHEAPSYRLEMDGGAGMFLCKAHWAAEMAKRRERNLQLGPAHRYPVLAWPDGR